MAGTTRTFTYNIIPPPQEVSRVENKARRLLGWACDGDSRITCHDVSGSSLGVVTLSMTIKARDRWWATQLAQDVLNRVLWGLKGIRLDLQSVGPEPHTNRGHARTRSNRLPDDQGL